MEDVDVVDVGEAVTAEDEARCLTARLYNEAIEAENEVCAHCTSLGCKLHVHTANTEA